MDKQLERLATVCRLCRLKTNQTKGVILLNAFKIIGWKFWKSRIMIWEMTVSTFIHQMFVIHGGENWSITKER